MKKFISVFLAILFTFSLSVTSFAVNTTVTADDVSVEPGELFEITYSIKNNRGIMGCAFVVDYNKSAFEVVSVQKGSILKGGMFNDSIGSGKDNFKIVWSSTGNVTGDGELFTVTFKAQTNASGNYKIKLACEKDDTFNENWEDVRIDCETVNVKVGNDAPVSFWVKITDFFVNIYNYIVSLFK